MGDTCASGGHVAKIADAVGLQAPEDLEYLPTDGAVACDWLGGET